MMAELREHVATKIGKIARPANIVFTPELPKTRSGKIMRRLLKDVSENRTLGDTTTLADPTVVEEIKDRAVAEAVEGGLASPLEVRAFEDADVEGAAELLTERHERHRASEPLLAPRWTTARAGRARAWETEGASGAVALVGRRARRLPHRRRATRTSGGTGTCGSASSAMPRATPSSSGTSIASPRRAGWTTARELHVALVPAVPELAEPWFRLAFGHMQAHGIRESGRHRGSASRRDHRALRDDRAT